MRNSISIWLMNQLQREQQRSHEVTAAYMVTASRPQGLWSPRQTLDSLNGKGSSSASALKHMISVEPMRECQCDSSQVPCNMQVRSSALRH